MNENREATSGQRWGCKPSWLQTTVKQRFVSTVTAAFWIVGLLLSQQFSTIEARALNPKSFVNTVLYTSIENGTTERPLRIIDHTLESAVNVFNQNEFVIMTKLRQERDSVIKLLHFQDTMTRKLLLEIEISSLKAQFRVRFADGDGGAQELAFPKVQLGDLRTHKVALRFSGDEISLYVDCARVGARFIPERHRVNFTKDSRLLLFGDSEARDSNTFAGDVEYLKAAAGSQVISQIQCPLLDSECPTCGEFQVLQRQQNDIVAQLVGEKKQLQKQVEGLLKMVFELKDSVEELERTALPHCWPDGKRINNGTIWQEGCKNCICKNKKITCSRIECPLVQDCNSNVDPCCKSSCGRNCSHSGSEIIHGTSLNKRGDGGCTVITCNAGVLSFRNETCPELSCPDSERILEEGECCPRCRLADHCGSFKGQCAENAECVGHGFSAKCVCIEGYEGDGRVKCQDIDECRSEAQHHCPEHSVCVNSAGNYSCHCLEGFRMDSRDFCVDVDECFENNFCDRGATCVNTVGGYLCQCPDGYRSEGRACKPVCSSPCKHGGICVAPERCECRLGYRGSYCEHDVNECQENLHQCGPHATCTNLPGWYRCQCNRGYHPVMINGTTRCIDLDECISNQHTCLNESACVNREGSYHCRCPDGTDSCLSSCQVSDRGLTRSIPSGRGWLDEATCETCACDNGARLCKPVQCNCDQTPNRRCCPHCFQSDEFQCKLSGDNGTRVLIANGQRFTHGCQVCECMNGWLDCQTATCPRPTCSEPLHAPDLCCPICPEKDLCAPAASRGRGCHHLNSLFEAELHQTKLGRVSTCQGCPSEDNDLMLSYSISTPSSFSDKRYTRRSLDDADQLFKGSEKYYIGCIVLLVAALLVQQILYRRQLSKTASSATQIEDGLQQRRQNLPDNTHNSR